MHLLAVFCHPRRRSFTGALLDSFASGVREAGHEVELADLYSEGFDPSFRVEDYAQLHRPTDDFATITYGFYVKAVETVIAALEAFDALDASTTPLK